MSLTSVAPGRLEEEAALRWHRHRIADQMLEGRGGRAARVDALRDHRQLVRVADQHDRPGTRPDRDGVCERHLAGLVDEQDVERAVELRSGEEPAGAGHDVDRPGGKGRGDVGVGADAGHAIEVTDVGVGLLDDADRDPLLGRGLDDRLDQVADRLVRLRGDADPLPGPHEVEDHPGAGVGLAGPRRTLDRQHARSSSSARRRAASRASSPGSTRAAPSRPLGGARAQEHVPNGPIGAGAVDAVRDDRIGDAKHGLLLGDAREGPGRDQRRRMWPIRVPRRLRSMMPRDVVDTDDRAGGLAGPGRRRVARVEAVILWLEPVAPVEHHALAPEFLDEVETRQGIALADELLDRSGRPSARTSATTATSPRGGASRAGRPAAGDPPPRTSVIGREVRGESGDPFLDGRSQSVTPRTAPGASATGRPNRGPAIGRPPRTGGPPATSGASTSRRSRRGCTPRSRRGSPGPPP